MIEILEVDLSGNAMVNDTTALWKRLDREPNLLAMKR